MLPAGRTEPWVGDPGLPHVTPVIKINYSNRLQLAGHLEQQFKIINVCSANLRNLKVQRKTISEILDCKRTLVVKLLL